MSSIDQDEMSRSSTEAIVKPSGFQATPEPANSHAISFGQVVAANRRLLLKFTILGALLSIVIAVLIPNHFEATARLMPPDQTTGTGAAALATLAFKGGDTVSSLAGDLLGLRTTAATVVAILNSRTVQDDLINRFDLRRVYGRKLYEDTRRILGENTSIFEDNKSGLITITVEDRDRVRAVELTRAYVDELNSRVSQLSTSAARREREFLEGRLQAIKRELDESSLKLSQFSSRTRTFDPSLQDRAMLEATSALQGQLIAAETDLSGLQQIYGPENARVRAASARVGELRSKMRNVTGTAGVQVGPDSDSVAGQPYPSLQELPLLGNTYYDLYRRTKINAAVYEALTQQFELARVEEAKQIPSVKVLDEPVVPERKSWPPRTKIVAAGTLLSALLFIGSLFVTSAIRRRDPADPVRICFERIEDRVVSGLAPFTRKTRSALNAAEK